MIHRLGTKTTCSVSYGKEKPPIRKPNGAREKAMNPSPSGIGPPARQPHQNKKSNSDYLTGAKKENQIKTWGRINRKTLAVDTNI